MTNLGTKDKLDTAKLAGKILAAIAAGIAKDGAGLLPKDMVGSINSALDNIGGDALLEAGQKATEKILEGEKGIGEDIGGALKGLLKK